MPREFIQELRGDVSWETIDIYDHIDLKDLKEAYWLAFRSWESSDAMDFAGLTRPTK
jgi:hypothetical protein